MNKSFPNLNYSVKYPLLLTLKLNDMKKFMPLQIREYKPLSELEMKNIFGGSGESETGSKKCAIEGQNCVVTYSYNIQTQPNTPVETIKVPVSGTCHTSGSVVTVPAGYDQTLYSCVCEIPSGVEIVHPGSSKPELTTPCVNIDNIVP